MWRSGVGGQMSEARQEVGNWKARCERPSVESQAEGGQVWAVQVWEARCWRPEQEARYERPGVGGQVWEARQRRPGMGGQVREAGPSFSGRVFFRLWGAAFQASDCMFWTLPGTHEPRT